MKTIELGDVAALSPFVRPGSQSPVLLTEHGEARAAVVPLGTDEAEQLLLSLSPEFQAILQRSEKRLASEGGLTSDQVRQRLGLD